jgi:hypothetical protein
MGGKSNGAGTIASGSGSRADILQTVRWELALVEDTRGHAALERIAARCRKFVEDWEARRANPEDALDLVRATLEPIGTLGSRNTQHDLLRLGEACLAAGKELDLFQGRYAALVRALASVLESRTRR